MLLLLLLSTIVSVSLCNNDHWCELMLNVAEFKNSGLNDSFGWLLICINIII